MRIEIYTKYVDYLYFQRPYTDFGEMMKEKIRVVDLYVSYDGVQALKGITVSIPSKRITSIMGPSGCGKSTFLRSLNRMIEIIEEAKVSGAVYLDDVNIYDKRVEVTWVRKKIGMVFQKPTPLPMSIYDNVAYGPRIHGVRDRRELDHIVRSVLMKVGLWDEVKDRLYEPATRLSGGQQQRLSIARALAVKPEVLLLDEPTSSLDPISTLKIESLLRELARDYTIVIVTHNIHQAKRIADYVLFMYLGRLVEYGFAREIFSRPRNEATKKFVLGKVS